MHLNMVSWSASSNTLWASIIPRKVVWQRLRKNACVSSRSFRTLLRACDILLTRHCSQTGAPWSLYFAHILPRLHLLSWLAFLSPIPNHSRLLNLQRYLDRCRSFLGCDWWWVWLLPQNPILVFSNLCSTHILPKTFLLIYIAIISMILNARMLHAPMDEYVFIRCSPNSDVTDIKILFAV